jgi:hypothetical protein
MKTPRSIDRSPVHDGVWHDDVLGRHEKLQSEAEENAAAIGREVRMGSRLVAGSHRSRLDGRPLMIAATLASLAVASPARAQVPFTFPTLPGTTPQVECYFGPHRTVRSLTLPAASTSNRPSWNQRVQPRGRRVSRRTPKTFRRFLALMVDSG